MIEPIYKMLFVIGLVCIIVFLYHIISGQLNEGFQNSNADYKQETAYKAQVKLLSDKYNTDADKKRPVSSLLSTLSSEDMPESEQNFVNFYALACRFTGFMGPITESYFDPDIAVQMAVKAGCRVFVLEIDYSDKSSGELYTPRLVIRDVQGKFMVNYNSSKTFSISDVCDKINFYAFSSSQNNTDPVVIVLYFLRAPPGSYKSKPVLDYYSAVAKALSPFKDRILTNEINGGTFTRQKQEGQLLINKITNYNGKVLIFNNANTNGFREVNLYSSYEDLDYLTHLRLSYTQTKIGVTENKTSTAFGILDRADNYMIIPSDRTQDSVEQTKLRWTICLSADPFKNVPEETYKAITKKIGVHCVPIILFDDTNKYMFKDSLFKTYSFIPKPKELRYIKPPVVTPAQPNPSTNSNQGSLRAPSV